MRNLKPRKAAAPAKKTSVPSAPVRLSAEERREQLIRVAVHLFSRKGFNGTTTREIAAAAGVTEAIIFRHFATKEDLYTAIIDQRIKSPCAKEWLTALKVAMDDDNDQAVVRELIGCIICTHRDDPEFERLMLYAALERNEIALIYMRQVSAWVSDEFASYLKRRQRQGAMRAMSAEAALTTIVGMAKAYSLNKYVHGFTQDGLSDDEAVDLFTEVAMNGLCLPGPGSRTARARRG